jgi:hypothetical protein
MMPMTGSEAFRALTAIRPDLPVVVCTGAADSHIDTDEAPIAGSSRNLCGRTPRPRARSRRRAAGPRQPHLTARTDDKRETQQKAPPKRGSLFSVIA